MIIDRFGSKSHTRPLRLLVQCLSLVLVLGLGVTLYQFHGAKAYAAQRVGSNIANTSHTTAPGFDVCSYPSTSTMQAWWNSSPYRWVNIYLGGINRTCKTPPPASWVTTVYTMGWSFVPTYVGLQAPAPCVNPASNFESMSLNTSTSFAQGKADADDAVITTEAAGINSGSIIYDDMEHWYDPQTPGQCDKAVIAYTNGWDQELHSKGFRAGMYMAGDNLYILPPSGITQPDDMWIAETGFVSSKGGYDSACTVYGNHYFSDSVWHSHRLYQYEVDGGSALSHNETWGGASISSIDSDCADGDVVGHGHAAINELVVNGPALATFNNRLYVAWQGTDAHLNVMSAGDGTTFGSKVTLGDTTYGQPSLAGFNNSLFLAFQGTDNTIYIESTSDGQHFVNHTGIAGQSTHAGPAIAVFNSQLYLAFEGADQRLNVMSSPDGIHFGNQVTLSDTTNDGAAPALNAYNSRLYLAWQGTGSIPTIYIQSTADGKAFANHTGLSDTTGAAPALTHNNGRLDLGWQGTNTKLNVESGTDGVHFSNKVTLFDTTSAGPALASFAGQLYIAWAGTDNPHHLNIGTTID